MRVRAPSGRHTNLTLSLALAVTFATGVGAVATGSARGFWIVVGHGVGAATVVLLVPWKTRVVRAGIPLHPVGRWPSLLLAGLTVLALLLGAGSATGVVRSVAGYPTLWLHIATALTALPLLVWHLLVRPVRPRRADLSRRTLVRTGVLGAIGGGLYLATAAVVDVLGLPGATRRFTGSYETGTDHPERMPNTIWLADTVPVLHADQWRLTVVDRGGTARRWTLAELASGPAAGAGPDGGAGSDGGTGAIPGPAATATVTWRAVLDCTSGWWAAQDWTGVPVARLLPDPGTARSVVVRSATGYWVRLPVRDLDRLLVATAVGGTALSTGHGYPLRLVAPGRRGYWWVKWVVRIELSDAPWWSQPPFPVT